jgi:CubicO group peptidase (beta-lactamase class C family)
MQTQRFLRTALATLLMSWAPFADCQTADRTSDHIRRIENGFAPVSLAPDEPPVKLDLRQIMEISNVSQMSIAVIDDYRIDWAKGYGLTDAGGPVTAHTLFPACSISKPVTTLAALRLVEQGKLSLDEDVNLNSSRGRCRRTRTQQSRKSLCEES